MALAVKRLSEAERDEAGYLRLLGERIREARARRGMTRKILARDSGVSERYLAQLETGHGNISILLLRQVAAAMDLALADLVRDGPEPAVELSLLVQSLSRLTPAELVEARKLIAQSFSGAAEQGRRNRLALIGLRGAGKSTLGAMLARDMEMPFVELDREIEKVAGASLAEIFDLYGQAAFRRYERRALELVLERDDCAVIATGGSIVSDAATFDLLLTSCFAVWLTAAPEEHMGRVVAQSDFRPMAGSEEAMEDLRGILAGRAALYAKADITIDTSGKSVAESYKQLREKVRKSR